ncbi:MAG: hypothetical protein LQ345_006549 [Seirophora villosa]|nr:MAG: hypothetical protein LQ345_006549 [Seirophora villosa]
MAPGRRVKIEKSGIVFGNLELENLEDEDPQRIGEPRRHRVYESKKILDILYRSIDERSFFQDLHGRRIVSKNDCKTSQGVLTDLWEYILAETTGLAWVHYIEEAATIRETYVGKFSACFLVFADLFFTQT